MYEAVNSMLSPVNMMVKFDHESDVKIMNSSPIRLIEGGRAIFVRQASSHHAAIRGRRVCRPRARIMVRLWIRS